MTTIEDGASRIVHGGASQPVHVTNDALGVSVNAGAQIDDGGAGWAATRTVTSSADMSAGAFITNAPTSGQKTIIRDLLISVGASMSVSITEETSGAYLCPILYLPANSFVQITTRSNLKLALADKRVRATTSAAGNISIMALYDSEA